MKKKDYFSAMNKTLGQLEEAAVDLGANPETLNPMNALRKIQKELRDYSRAQDTARELGYKTVPIALKALSQYRNKEREVEVADLPQVFHRPPAIWLSGRAKTKLKTGFAPMRVRDAERQHRVMMPLLIEAWKLTEGDTEVQQEIEKEYRNSSAADFERALYEYIYELEEPTLEEQLADRAAVSAAEFAEWQAENARAREAREARRNRTSEGR